MDETTRTEAVEIIRSLIDRIVLWPAESGGLEVELLGDLARMIHIGERPDDGNVAFRSTSMMCFPAATRVWMMPGMALLYLSTAALETL
jgi:hypothetical protein